jgi:hypothetical protein
VGVYDITTKTSSIVTLPGTSGQAVDVAAGGDAYTWVAEHRAAAGTLSVMQLDSSNHVINQYLDLSGADTASITDRQTVWAVANTHANNANAIYFQPCSDGTWQPDTINYTGSGPSSGGGIVSANDGSAWFIDSNNGVLVHVSKPTGACTSAIKGKQRAVKHFSAVVHEHTPSIRYVR